MIMRVASIAWWRDQGRQAWAKPELRWLGAILVLAAVLRIVWVVYAAREPQGLHDPWLYFLYGQQIAAGNGYTLPDWVPNGGPSVYYPVGYPAAVGGVLALVTHTPIPDNLVLASAFFNVFLGVATAGLAYELGRRLFTPAVGLLTALWLAVFPNLIYHTATFLTETLFNFLMMAALVVLLSASWRDRRLGRERLLLFGVLLGLSALVRPISLLFLPLLLIVWLIAGFGWRRTFGYSAVVLVATFAVIAPWSIRNAVVANAPVIISANVGDNLCMGHYPGAQGHFALPDHCFGDEGYEGLGRAEYEVRRNNDNIRKAFEFALENPRREVTLIFKKARWLWDNDHDGLWAVESYGDDPFISPALRTGLGHLADTFFVITAVVGGLGLVAFVRLPWEPRRLFFLLALLGLANVPLIFFGDARFHVPVLPLLALSAAALVVSLGAIPRLVASRAARPGPPAGSDGMSATVEVAEREGSVPQQDALQNAEAEKERDQRASALADEGQRDPGHR